MKLDELDEFWSGKHQDKETLKYLCRKYSPQLVMSWIERGLTLANKEEVIKWLKTKLTELGVDVLEKTPEETPDERLFKDDYGDYFSE